MRIGIDARELCGRATGAGRYLKGLLDEWAIDEHARQHEFVLYVPESLTLNLDSHRFATHLVAGKAGTFWEQVQLPRVARADHLDMFFAPAYAAPLALNVPIVVTIHDVSFMAHPEWFRTREGIRRRWFTRESAKRARLVLTVSDFSRHELLEFLPIPASRVHVVRSGVTRLPGVDRAVERNEERVLFVGSIFNRRHVPDLIRSFGLVARRRPGASLDLVGDNRTYPHEDLAGVIVAEGLEGRVRWHRYVTDEQLRELYRRARAFAFLSEYEGHGMTPLEAIAVGLPLVLLNTPVARETCGDAAVYVSAGDLAGTALALEQVLGDETLRSRLRAAAPAALARFQWPHAAKQTLALIESAGEMGQSRDRAMA